MYDMEYYVEQMLEKFNAELHLEYTDDFKKVTVNYHTEQGQLVTSGCIKEKDARLLLDKILNNQKAKVKRVNADISLYLHNKLKDKCLAENITMRQALEKMIRNYLSD